MRPDRLVVGEVRGGEVVDLLAALNTGHEGGCGTLHANSAADVPARVEALALAAGLGRDGGAQPARVRRRRRCSTWRAAATARRLLREVAVPVARRRRAGRDAHRRSSSPTTASHLTGPGADRLAAAARRDDPCWRSLARGARRGAAGPAAGAAAPRRPGAAAVAGRRRLAVRWLWSVLAGRRGSAVLGRVLGGRGGGVGLAGAAASAAPAPRRRRPGRRRGCSRPASCWRPSSRAGQPPGQALDRAAAAWPPLRRWPRHSASGATCRRRCARCRPQPGCRRPAAGRRRLAGGPPHRAAGSPTRSTGSPTSIRAASATRRVVEGELASARATARLVAGLPVLALLMGSGAGGDPVGLPARPPARAGLPGRRPGVRLRRAVVDRGASPATWARPVSAVPGGGPAPRPRSLLAGAARATAPAPVRGARPRRARHGAGCAVAAGCWPSSPACRLRCFVGGPAGLVAGAGRGRRRLVGDRPRRAAGRTPRARGRSAATCPTLVLLLATALRAGAPPGDGVRHGRAPRCPGRRRDRLAGVADRLALGRRPGAGVGGPGRRPGAGPARPGAGPRPAHRRAGGRRGRAARRRARTRRPGPRSRTGPARSACGPRCRSGSACCRRSCCSGIVPLVAGLARRCPVRCGWAGS